MPAKCVCGRDRLSGFQFRILYNMLLDNRGLGGRHEQACLPLTYPGTYAVAIYCLSAPPRRADCGGEVAYRI